MSENCCQLNPNATKEEMLYDFLGKYTVLLNGTYCEKQAGQPAELNYEHKKEIVDRVLRILEDEAQRLESELSATKERLRIAMDVLKKVESYFHGGQVMAIRKIAEARKQIEEVK